MSITDPRDTALNAENTTLHGHNLLLHCAELTAKTESLSAVLRSAINAATDLPTGTAIEVIIQGPTVTLLTPSSPLTKEIAAAFTNEIKIIACGNSLRSSNMAPDHLIPEITTVAAAISHLTRRQWEGWAYARL